MSNPIKYITKNNFPIVIDDYLPYDVLRASKLVIIAGGFPSYLSGEKETYSDIDIFYPYQYEKEIYLHYKKTYNHKRTNAIFINTENRYRLEDLYGVGRESMFLEEYLKCETRYPIYYSNTFNQKIKTPDESFYYGYNVYSTFMHEFKEEKPLQYVFIQSEYIDHLFETFDRAKRLKDIECMNLCLIAYGSYVSYHFDLKASQHFLVNIYENIYNLTISTLTSKNFISDEFIVEFGNILFKRYEIYNWNSDHVNNYWKVRGVIYLESNILEFCSNINKKYQMNKRLIIAELENTERYNCMYYQIIQKVKNTYIKELFNNMKLEFSESFINFSCQNIDEWIKNIKEFAKQNNLYLYEHEEDKEDKECYIHNCDHKMSDDCLKHCFFEKVLKSLVRSFKYKVPIENRITTNFTRSFFKDHILNRYAVVI
uniref:Uncharacterized protein n=1 Tax=viral metagenome TaxID=1070528 RepID=A0A6C0JSU8_9ZZZZ